MLGGNWGGVVEILLLASEMGLVFKLTMHSELRHHVLSRLQICQKF